MPPDQKRQRHWIRAGGKISDPSHESHLSALAYMSDSYFIGTVSRVHNLWRFAGTARRKPSTPTTSSTPPVPAGLPAMAALELPNTLAPKPGAAKLKPSQTHVEMAALEEVENAGKPQKRIGMMVSLDHTIYFHKPRAIRADEWMFAEMESHWAGELCKV